MTSDAGFLVPQKSCVSLQMSLHAPFTPEIPGTLTGKLFRRALLREERDEVAKSAESVGREG
jgi:hypothetical protein